jgi:hypothetical protein
MPIRRDRARAARPVATQREQQDDHEDERHRGLEAGQIAQRSRQDPIAVAGDQVLHDAEHEPTRERDRDGAQPPEHDHGQRPEHDQRVDVVGEREQRRDQHAAQAGEDHCQHPRDRRSPRRIHAAQARQVVTVDDRPHLESEASPPNDIPEGDAGEQGGREHGKLVAVEHDAVKHPVHVRGSRSEPRDPGSPRSRAAVDEAAESENLDPDGDDEPLHEVWERDDQPDRSDDARVHRRVRQAAQHEPVEQESEKRGEQEYGDDQRRNDREPIARVELVVEVRDRERDRSVREVEDSRGGVGKDESRRHD